MVEIKWSKQDDDGWIDASKNYSVNLRWNWLVRFVMRHPWLLRPIVWWRERQ
jgi:hypothetical protein